MRCVFIMIYSVKLHDEGEIKLKETGSRCLLHAVYVYYSISAEAQLAYGDEFIALTLCGFNKSRQILFYFKPVVAAEDYAVIVKLWKNNVQYGLCAALLFPVDGVYVPLVDYMVVFHVSTFSLHLHTAGGFDSWLKAEERLNLYMLPKALFSHVIFENVVGKYVEITWTIGKYPHGKVCNSSK